MTTETETAPSVEAELREAAAEVARKRAEDAPAGNAPQDTQGEPVSLENRYRSLREAMDKIEDELGITTERDRALNAAKQKVAELEKLVAAYVEAEDAERPKWAAPQTATILSPDPNRLVALKRT
jgi:hypothetical protein